MHNRRVTGEIRTHNRRGHIPELRLLSYGHKDDGWNRTSVDRALQARASPLGHVVMSCAGRDSNPQAVTKDQQGYSLLQ